MEEFRIGSDLHQVPNLSRHAFYSSLLVPSLRNFFSVMNRKILSVVDGS